MGGKTSTESKRKYNEAAYDRPAITIPKGRKADIEAKAKEEGLTINSLTNQLYREYLHMTEEEWKEKTTIKMNDDGV